MEYFNHGDLGMYKGEIKEVDAKIVSQQLLEGLQIMHEKGFAHRDLKPQVFLILTVSYNTVQASI
jgi:serine/threonine protein kinase